MKLNSKLEISFLIESKLILYILAREYFPSILRLFCKNPFTSSLITLPSKFCVLIELITLHLLSYSDDLGIVSLDFIFFNETERLDI